MTWLRTPSRFVAAVEMNTYSSLSLRQVLSTWVLAGTVTAAIDMGELLQVGKV